MTSGSVLGGRRGAAGVELCDHSAVLRMGSELSDAGKSLCGGCWQLAAGWALTGDAAGCGLCAGVAASEGAGTLSRPVLSVTG